jgi:MFS family permease
LARFDYKRILTLGFPLDAFNRDIKLICMSNFIGAFGEGLYIFMLSLYLIELHASIVEVGAFYSIMYLSAALSPLPGGFLADRYDRKKVILLSWGLWVFTPFIYFFSNNWVEMIPGGILWGASMLGGPAISAYVVTSAKDKTKTATLLASFISTWSLGYIFSPAVGGYLTALMGMKQVLLITTLLSAICTSVYLFISSQHAPKKTENRENREPAPKVSGSIKKRLLAWSVLYASLLFIMQTSRTFIAPFLTSVVQEDKFFVGLFGSVNFAGVAILGLSIARLSDRWGKVKAILVCVLLHALTTEAILFYHNSAFLLFTAFFWGGASAFGVLISAAVGAMAPETARARWISVPMTMGMTAAVVAPYFGGYLYEISAYLPFTVSLLGAVPVVALALTKPFEEKHLQ